jgi:hypothetical protein
MLYHAVNTAIHVMTRGKSMLGEEKSAFVWLRGSRQKSISRPSTTNYNNTGYESSTGSTALYRWRAIAASSNLRVIRWVSGRSTDESCDLTSRLKHAIKTKIHFARHLHVKFPFQVDRVNCSGTGKGREGFLLSTTAQRFQASNNNASYPPSIVRSGCSWSPYCREK